MARPSATATPLLVPSEPSASWETPACVLCGATETTEVLAIPYGDAPDGCVAVAECVACGLRRLTPRPREASAAGHYGDAYNAFVGRRRGPVKQAAWNLLRDVAAGARGVGRALGALRPVARWAFDVVVPLDGPRLPRVLEIGCGYGDLLLHLRARGCAVTGVDLDSRAVAKARSYGLDVHAGPLRNVALAPASFDVCVLCHSLEHVADPLDELRRIARLLRPGGSLHVAVPNGRAAAFAHEGAAWEHASIPLHAWFFDPVTLTALLETAGYVVPSPPVATSSYRPIARWWREMRAFGPRAATRTLGRWVHSAATRRAGGDVVRVIARRP